MYPIIEIKSFESLSNTQLYELLKLRNEVFIVEQNCVYPDIDDKDQLSNHLLICINNQLAAYCRILPAGLSYEECSIGRVISSPHFRGQGLGQLLMRSAISHIHKIFPNQVIRIGAQLYLKRFYESFGFIQVSEEYLEDGIPHIEMLLEFGSK